MVYLLCRNVAISTDSIETFPNMNYYKLSEIMHGMLYKLRIYVHGCWLSWYGDVVGVASYGCVFDLMILSH